jgi:UDP-N-acetylglucosamine--N-acetylmuramyl-(pentapeptide) pyrophosphoryl-undecaprenol N-acetylglucosamine transferase
MKIVFTGGGSGGHFYPIIAVAQEVTALLEQQKELGPAELYFISDEPYNLELLKQNNITFIQNKTGKLRMYFSVENFIDMFRTFFAVIRAFFLLYKIYPDVVFSKGAYASFPVTLAARWLRIPVIIHESDSSPGRANKFAGTFAKRIAISFPRAAQFFPADRVALTGNPIRKELFEPIKEGAYEAFGFSPNIPTIFIIGGSQGAQRINDMLITASPELVKDFQIIHQIGAKNINTCKATIDMMLEKNPLKDRYKMLPYLNLQEMRMAAGIADLVVSRGGSTIFEIAAWGVPSVIIPITETHGDHQRINAYEYARAGACIVMEENNLTPKLFVEEVKRIVGDKSISEGMRASAKTFTKKDAALNIAREIINILKQHTSL